MNYIFAGMLHAIGMLILSRHDQKCKRCTLEHLFETINDRRTGKRFTIEFIPLQMQRLGDEILKIPPHGRMPMPNEDTSLSIAPPFAPLRVSGSHRPNQALILKE